MIRLPMFFAVKHLITEDAEHPSGEEMLLACFSFGKIFEKSVEISPRFCYNMAYLYAQVQGLRIHAGRPIHEMGTSHIFDGKELNRIASHGLTVPFLNKTTYIRDG